MDMNLVPHNCAEENTVSLTARHGLTTDGHGAGEEQDEGVTEFMVPWINAQGSIQMIQAYLC